MTTRVRNPGEVKMKTIETKLSRISVKVVMEKSIIKNYFQLKKWMKWHRGDQKHRLAQFIGKQYSFNAEVSEIEEFMGKYRELERRWSRPTP